MGRERARRVAIVGGGPAGSALASWLARAGVRTAFFTRGKRPPIIIGESLVPAVIPFLRDLGIEDEVAAYSQYKPGATFSFHPIFQIRFRFAEARGARTPYAYNVPRDRFDATLMAAAERAGAVRIDASARIERDPDGTRIRLAAEADELRGRRWAGADLIVDATGRARTVARLLDLTTVEGLRRTPPPRALHRGAAGATRQRPQRPARARLELAHPLPGRVSVGIVIRPSIAASGTAPRAVRRFLRRDECARQWGEKAERITPVVRTRTISSARPAANGQAGDAFGFIDRCCRAGS
jgi:2-polyprenyl-6-methoxyphenol hydroxylase-like FAD-dependent oxidoreductase